MKPVPSRPGSPKVATEMTDEDVVSKVATLFGRTHTRIPSRKPGRWKDTYCAVVSGRKAVEVMQRLHPLMSGRRQTQIDLALEVAEFRVPNRKFTDEQVQEVVSRYNSGEKVNDLAKEFGMAKRTVYTYIDGTRRMGV